MGDMGNLRWFRCRNCGMDFKYSPRPRPPRGQQIRAASQEWQRAIQAWRPVDASEADLAHVYTADRRESRRALSFFRRGMLVKAARLVYEMDTILRDNVPETAWKMMSDALDAVGVWPTRWFGHPQQPPTEAP